MQQHDALELTVRASPPVAVVGLDFAGISIADWLILATLIYTVLSIVALIRDKFWRKRERPTADPTRAGGDEPD